MLAGRQSPEPRLYLEPCKGRGLFSENLARTPKLRVGGAPRLVGVASFVFSYDAAWCLQWTLEEGLEGLGIDWWLGRCLS